MHKSALVLFGVVASVTAAGLPKRSIGGSTINLPARNHTQDLNTTRTGTDAPEVNLTGTQGFDLSVHIPLVLEIEEIFWQAEISPIVIQTPFEASGSPNLTKGPAFVNATKPAEICGTKGIAKGTLVPLQGLNSSATSTSTVSYGLPKPSASTGTYGLPIDSHLKTSQGTPSTRSPFAKINLGVPSMDQIAVGLLVAASLVFTARLTSHF